MNIKFAEISGVISVWKFDEDSGKYSIRPASEEEVTSYKRPTEDERGRFYALRKSIILSVPLEDHDRDFEQEIVDALALRNGGSKTLTPNSLAWSENAETHFDGKAQTGREHPSEVFLQAGIASIRAGRPSDLFLQVLDELAAGSRENDFLADLLPSKFPRVNFDNQCRHDLMDARIIQEYQAFVAKYLSKPGNLNKTIRDAISQFFHMNQTNEKTYRRVLKRHQLLPHR